MYLFFFLFNILHLSNMSFHLIVIIHSQSLSTCLCQGRNLVVLVIRKFLDGQFSWELPGDSRILIWDKSSNSKELYHTRVTTWESHMTTMLLSFRYFDLKKNFLHKNLVTSFLVDLKYFEFYYFNQF